MMSRPGTAMRSMPSSGRMERKRSGFSVIETHTTRTNGNASRKCARTRSVVWTEMFSTCTWHRPQPRGGAARVRCGGCGAAGGTGMETPPERQSLSVTPASLSDTKRTCAFRHTWAPARRTPRQRAVCTAQRDAARRGDLVGGAHVEELRPGDPRRRIPDRNLTGPPLRQPPQRRPARGRRGGRGREWVAGRGGAGGTLVARMFLSGPAGSSLSRRMPSRISPSTLTRSSSATCSPPAPRTRVTRTHEHPAATLHPPARARGAGRATHLERVALPQEAHGGVEPLDRLLPGPALTTLTRLV